MSAITYAEILGLIRQIIAEPNQLRLKDPSSTWDEIYSGNVFFEFHGWNFAIYNDCQECDYIDYVTAPDERTGGFNDWFNGDGLHPMEELTSAELCAMEDAVENAK